MVFGDRRSNKNNSFPSCHLIPNEFQTRPHLSGISQKGRYLMPVSEKRLLSRTNSSPSRRHRQRRHGGYLGYTASLRLETPRAFIFNKIYFFCEPNEPKEPKPERRLQLLRQGRGNQNTKRTHFSSQSKQNEISYTPELEPVSAYRETWEPCPHEWGHGSLKGYSTNSSPVAFKKKRSEYKAVGLPYATTLKRCL